MSNIIRNVKSVGVSNAGALAVPQPVGPPAGSFLFSWGYNKNGELGIGTSGPYGNPNYSRYSPVQVGSLRTWASPSYASYSEIFAKRTDNTVWSWGRNALGQLGVGDIVFRSSPTLVGAAVPTRVWGRVTGGSDAGSAGIVIGPGFNSRKAYFWGQVFDVTLQFAYVSSPIQIGARTDWQDILAQEQFFMGIIGGKLYGMGNNDHFQLGLGYASPLSPNISSPTQVGTSTNWLMLNRGWGPTTSALQNDRRLWIWGFVNSGQSGLAYGSTYHKYASVPVLVSTDKTWRMVNTGGFHVLGIDTNGYLWAWGGNGNGQLGLGDVVTRSSPVQVGTNKWLVISAGKDHSLGVRSDGTLWAWGMNNYGKLGNGQHGIPNTNPSLNSQSSPVQVGSLTTWNWCAASKYNSFGWRT